MIKKKLEVEVEDLVIDSKKGFYMRLTGSQRENTSQQMAQLYQCKRSYIVPSGLNAIYLTMKLLFKHHPGVYLISSQVYCDTPTNLSCLVSEYPNSKLIEFHPAEKDNLLKLIKTHYNEIGGLFVESASNPEGYIPDWDMIKKNLPEKSYIVVDNTWLTALAFNPFHYGAHIVVESCSKYLSMGKCIAGAVNFKDDKFLDLFYGEMRIMGLHVSPVHCELIGNGLIQLQSTIKLCYERILMIIENCLKKNKWVLEILYPTIKTHPSHLEFNKYIVQGFGPGVIWFRVKNLSKTKKNQLGKLLDKCHIVFSTSFGKEHDLIDMWPVISEDYIWLRLSAGYNDKSDIVSNLNQLFNLLNNSST